MIRWVAALTLLATPALAGGPKCLTEKVCTIMSDNCVATEGEGPNVYGETCVEGDT
ncbi:hypothetical protein Q8W37_15880 [Shimia thalassica]|uniref:hypothetical protein n=1 Tax=Shimia thalassica TaxID=1715693 RepID=UPI00273460C8|nr:hypothetical protein [Shimia thalassica]MDP2581418.1 hypothetical protein [Shimia thalassica]